MVCKEQELEWADLCNAGWRSERVRELDKYGGLSRSAVARRVRVRANLRIDEREHTNQLLEESEAEEEAPAEESAKQSMRARRSMLPRRP